MTSPTAKTTHPATAMRERTAADPLGVKVASARGWYANQPKEAVPIGVNSPITIMTAPAATITHAPTQPSIAILALTATLRHYPRGMVRRPQADRLHTSRTPWAV